MAKDIIDKIREGIDSLVGTTNKAIETGKIQLEIQQLKLKIGGLQKGVGKYVYAKHQAEDLIVSLDEEELAAKLKELKFYTEKVKDLEEKLRASGHESKTE